MKVNGVDFLYPGKITLGEFMVKQGYGQQMAVVEINGEIISKDRWDTLFLTDADKLEIVTFVGGG